MENLVLDSTSVIDAKNAEIVALRKQSARANGKQFDAEMRSFIVNGKFDAIAWASSQLGRPMSASITTTIGAKGSKMENESDQTLSIQFISTPKGIVPSLGDTFVFSFNGVNYSFSTASRGTAILVALFAANKLKLNSPYSVEFKGRANGINAHIRLGSEFEKAYDELLNEAKTTIAPQVDELGN